MTRPAWEADGEGEAPKVRLGEWLVGNGPDADIAICTRVRFARNIDGFRFSTNMTDDEATELNAYLGSTLRNPDFGADVEVVDLGSIDELERNVLLERHLISREHALAERSRSVAVNDAESVSIMINEEDHIRAQVFGSGNQVPATYARAEAIDESLIGLVPLAFSEQFGFLTACPTNTGTGLRVSVMLHLPGLVWANEIDKATVTAQKIHLAVRGLWGEGSRAAGDFYQVSNQVTLGRSEQEILADVAAAVDRLLSWERDVRAALLKGEPRHTTLDRVFRALGQLQNARILSSEECLNSLSAVRFGIQQGCVQGLPIESLNQILLLSQPAHLQRLFGARLEVPDRDQRRASLVRAIVAPAYEA